MIIFMAMSVRYQKLGPVNAPIAAKVARC